MMALARLRRNNRLKAPYSFSRTMKKGQLYIGKYLNCYIFPKKYGDVRLGVTCVKQTPNAVWRNYYKRRLRLAYQANFNLLKQQFTAPVDIVLVAKHRAEKFSSEKYIADLAAILQNLSLHAKIRR